LGIWAAQKFPEIAAKAQPWVKNGSLVALLIFIVAGVSGNASYFVDYIGVVLLAVFLHDTVALALGYFCGA
ncbi:bile acid:sodium symporter family protein, partial [Rhodococcus erythropolis]|nr:bile acid:sodium symporter family protein [Rhodococcus erythropolis]